MRVGNDTSHGGSDHNVWEPRKTLVFLGEERQRRARPFVLARMVEQAGACDDIESWKPCSLLSKKAAWSFRQPQKNASHGLLPMGGGISAVPLPFITQPADTGHCLNAAHGGAFPPLPLRDALGGNGAGYALSCCTPSLAAPFCRYSFPSQRLYANILHGLCQAVNAFLIVALHQHSSVGVEVVYQRDHIKQQYKAGADLVHYLALSKHNHHAHGDHGNASLYLP